MPKIIFSLVSLSCYARETSNLILEITSWKVLKCLSKNHWQTILWAVATGEQHLKFSNSYGVAQRLPVERWSDHLVAPLGPQERAFPADTEFTRLIRRYPEAEGPRFPQNRSDFQDSYAYKSKNPPDTDQS